MGDTRTFRMPVMYTVCMAVIGSIGVGFGLALGGGRVSGVAAFGAALGVGLGMYLQKLTVSAEMVAQGKRKFRFAEGTVSFEQLTPFNSWLRLGRANGSAIVFTPSQGEKVQKIYFPLSQQDQEELTALVGKYSKA